MDNFEEYDDPFRYDLENTSIYELPLLEGYASKGKPIVELACGTGRVTIPFAEKGFTLIGVDIHEGMLERAKAKSENLNIEWIQQDTTRLSLSVKSDLIYMVGNSFQHFLTNESQDFLFQSVHKHIEPNGYFIFNTRFPSREELLQPETEEYWRTYTDHEGNKVILSTIAHYNDIEQIQHYTTIRKTESKEGFVTKSETKISLRYVYPQEMLRILEQNGFKIINIYQDWKETELDSNATELIYVCSKA